MNSPHAQPVVSVIVPVLNGEGVIGDCLAALLAQRGLSGPLEVIVVDNGSTDGTADVVKAFADRVPGLVLLREGRRGVSRARNAALARARAPVVACADADTLPTRRWAAEITAPLNDPSVVLVAGRVCADRPETAAERFLDWRGLYDAEAMSRRSPFPFALGMNTAVRTEAARAVGGWDETMTSGEDIDLSTRLITRYSARVVYAEKALLLHRHRATTDAMVRQARWYGQGAAQLYSRYADLVSWTPPMTRQVVRGHCTRAARAAAAGVGRVLRVVDGERAEMERHEWLWYRAYWSGFRETYRSERSAAK